jgi:hypothetical protein
MAITSGDGYIASTKQIIPFTKTGAVTTVALTRFGTFAAAGTPTAGTLAMTTALTGAVPDDTVAGYPLLNAFGGAATGYLTRVQYNSSVTGRMELWDKLFGINVSLTALATTTLSGQISYSGRIPNSSYAGLRIFMEVTTAISNTATTVTVTYTNQSGATGHTTVATAGLNSYTASRWLEITLQAGDYGVQKIESVIVGGTVATAGAVNILVVRPLWSNRVPLANGGGLDGIDRTGMPIVFATSALTLTCIPDATSTGVPDLNIEIANG